MTNEPLTEDWLGVLIQWLFFFGMLTVWLLPAFLFKNLAKRHNKPGWMNFILGLIVGFGSFQLAAFLMLILRNSSRSEMITKSASWLLFLVAFLFVWISVSVLKIFFRGKRSDTPLP